MADKANVSAVPRMPEKIEPGVEFQDPEVTAQFTFKWATTEYSKWGGEWVEVTCMSCPSKWAMHLGEHGELDKGERNIILGHAKEHQRKGFRMRRLVR